MLKQHSTYINLLLLLLQTPTYQHDPMTLQYTDTRLPAAVACLQELIDAQLAAAVAAAAAVAESADADDSGLPSAPLIDLAGETTTEVPESLRIEDNKASAS